MVWKTVLFDSDPPEVKTIPDRAPPSLRGDPPETAREASLGPF
jgi:hypothetical protein